MRLLARWGLLLKPEGQWQSWMELSDEFGRNLFQEIDYIHEGRNADRVRTMLKDLPEIQIPRVYWKYTGRRVLTLEYCPGIKIDHVAELEERGFNPAKIGNQLVNSYLEMVLMHGFFHADPHAGNLCIAPDGRIIIYDYGMMGEITDEQREGITGCIAAVIKKDTEELVRNLKNLGIIRGDAPTAPILRTLQPFIDYYAGKAVKELDFSDLEHDIDQITYDRALNLPPTLAYLLRAGTSLEGIARTLKPNFSFVEAAKPPLKKWVMSRPHHAASLVKVFINGNLSIGQEVLSKLANGKPSDAQTKPTKSDKPGKIASKPTAVLSAPASGNSEELSDLKSRIFMLENQLNAQAKERYMLAAMALWLLFSAVLGIPSQLHPYVIYFLIGNGVMGAIIMWHLVKHLRLDKTPTKKGTSRGQRR
jgi:predicted unusual protein kinase regulating ubiquinone biosynthesis (AarF/ABC1/UbiB family)